jgi:hypothetical protein
LAASVRRRVGGAEPQPDHALAVEPLVGGSSPAS